MQKRKHRPVNSRGGRVSIESNKSNFTGIIEVVGTRTIKGMLEEILNERQH